ncbi:MAG: hypothetical protein MN733_29550 [Nitrososphaera sp.]|nr:hypothetical protein [Nitrososphaera sp.]
MREFLKTQWQKLPPRVGTVVIVGLAVLAAGIAMQVWFGENLKHPEIWRMAGFVMAFFTVCMSVFGFCRDRAQARKHDENMTKLRTLAKSSRRLHADD